MFISFTFVVNNDTERSSVVNLVCVIDRSAYEDHKDASLSYEDDHTPCEYESDIFLRSYHGVDSLTSLTAHFFLAILRKTLWRLLSRPSILMASPGPVLRRPTSL